MGLDNNNIHGVDEMIAKIQAAQTYLSRDVNIVIGVEAVNHFKANFANEGFDNNKWAPRKTKFPLAKKVLTGQGSGDHLGDSIDYKVQGVTTIIYTDKVYAQIHNEGGEITVTPKMKKFFWAKHHEAKANGEIELADQYKWMALSKTIHIIKREFMGESTILNDKIVDKITRDLTRILN